MDALSGQMAHLRRFGTVTTAVFGTKSGR